VAVDITAAFQAASLIDFAVSAFGSLDVLVNNAGYEEGMPVTEITAAPPIARPKPPLTP
jgi:NAD(P)-dependent dehydrogenase (short-subunit alcohol dehydrogenase family)